MEVVQMSFISELLKRIFFGGNLHIRNSFKSLMGCHFKMMAKSAIKETYLSFVET